MSVNTERDFLPGNLVKTANTVGH